MSETKLVNGTLPIQRKYINAAVVGAAQLSANPASGSSCLFKQQYPSAVLDRPSDWNLGIVRFNIPFLRTPRFIDPVSDGSANPCKMTWTNPGGGLTTTSVQVSLELLNYTIDPFNTSYVYLVQQWIDVLQAAMTTVAGNMGFLSYAPAPLVTYNDQTNLINISANQGLFYPAPGDIYFAGNINIYINEAMWRMLPSLPGEFVNYTSLGLSSDYYYRIRLGNALAPLSIIASAVPGWIQGSRFAIGTLTSALVAGTAYSQLAKTATITANLYLGPGQALFLRDSASGATQTVFIGAATEFAGSTTLDTLMFSAIFSFPITTTTVYIYDTNVVSVNGLTTGIPSGTSLYLGTSTVSGINLLKTVRTGSLGDVFVYVEPYVPQLQDANQPLLTVGLDTITTETPVTSSWSSISTVRLKTSLIPVNAEMSPDIITSTITGSAGSSTAQLPLIAMVSDFTIDQSSTIVTNNIVQYVSEQPRWLDLVGDVPMTGIDFKAVWVDMQGNEHPIYCSQGMRFDVKCEFKRKDTKCLPGL